MRSSLALRNIRHVRHLRVPFRCYSLQYSLVRPSTTIPREGAPSQRHLVVSSAQYGTTGISQSTPTRDTAVGNETRDPNFAHPHKYTTGRRLENDQLQHDARHLHFGFAALSAKAVTLCPKARSVSACTKLEGRFNKAFLYTMDSGERIVARVPTRIAGPRRLTTNSEVATIAYSKILLLLVLDSVFDTRTQQSSPRPQYQSPTYSTGVTIHQITSDASTYSWNMSPAFSSVAVGTAFPAPSTSRSSSPSPT